MNTSSPTPVRHRRLFDDISLGTVLGSIGALLGIAFIVAGILVPKRLDNGAISNVLINIGSGFVSAVAVTMILENILSKAREEASSESVTLMFDPVRKDLSEAVDTLNSTCDELSENSDKIKSASRTLSTTDTRFKAFQSIGFTQCYSSRNDALLSFYDHAEKVILQSSASLADNDSSTEPKPTIDIVSSSARGLMGYIDRDPIKVQRLWRQLIQKHPNRFRLLLTHPAYAYLRRPAEERASGDIELEILKTAIFLYDIGMTSEQLRLYRGSPTVFTIQAGEYTLLNPYPYGQMAMQTLSLEFRHADNRLIEESQHSENRLVERFEYMHFKHTWAFKNQPSKRVNGQQLVEGIDHFEDILTAFGECTFTRTCKCLRLTKEQVDELDKFTARIRSENEKGKLYKHFESAEKDVTPFMDHATKNLRLSFRVDFEQNGEDKDTSCREKQAKDSQGDLVTGTTETSPDEH